MCGVCVCACACVCVIFTLAFLHYQYKEIEAARTQYHTQCELRQALEEQVDIVRISMYYYKQCCDV